MVYQHQHRAEKIRHNRKSQYLYVECICGHTERLEIWLYKDPEYWSFYERDDLIDLIKREGGVFLRNTRFKMKDGSTKFGTIWEFNPKKGYLTIVEEDNKILLRDIESAITKGVRTRINKLEDVDVLEKARREGWRGH